MAHANEFDGNAIYNKTNNLLTMVNAKHICREALPKRAWGNANVLA